MLPLLALLGVGAAVVMGRSSAPVSPQSRVVARPRVISASGREIVADPATGAVTVSGVTAGKYPRPGQVPARPNSTSSVGGPSAASSAGALCGVGGAAVAAAIAVKTGGASAPISGVISSGSSAVICGTGAVAVKSVKKVGQVVSSAGSGIKRAIGSLF